VLQTVDTLRAVVASAGGHAWMPSQTWSHAVQRGCDAVPALAILTSLRRSSSGATPYPGACPAAPGASRGADRWRLIGWLPAGEPGPLVFLWALAAGGPPAGEASVPAGW
jgi:hypothetical protein